MKLFSLATFAVIAATAASAASIGNRGMVSQARELEAGQKRAAAAINARGQALQNRDLLHPEVPGLIQNVGQLVALIEKGLGITALENQINLTLGGHLEDIENSLGLTKAEKAIGLTQGPMPQGVIEKIGALVKYIDYHLGVTTLENALNGILGGTLFDLENALGVTYLLKELNIE